MGRKKIGPGHREREKAANQPLPVNSRELVKRMTDKGFLTIGHTSAPFGSRERSREHINDCTPSQAHGIVARGYGRIVHPDRSGPKRLIPLPAAFKILLFATLCLLVCSCGPAVGTRQDNRAVTSLEGDSDTYDYQVLHVEDAGVTYIVLIVQSSYTGRAVAVTKLGTSFTAHGDKYQVDDNGNTYVWTRVD